MALGFLRLFGSAGTGSGSGENDSENEVELENKVNVKRRRRRDDRGSQGESIQELRVGGEKGVLMIQVDKGYYPGMVNLSGTLCYMNSVLQVSSTSSTSLSEIGYGPGARLRAYADVPGICIYTSSSNPYGTDYRSRSGI